jgi:dimethylhistidine N-methyltransferase
VILVSPADGISIGLERERSGTFRPKERERAVTGYRVVLLLSPEERRAALEDDVATGLSAARKRIPSKWHYDAEGSRLFGEITTLPEYYLTRRERAILGRHAAEIVARAGADTLVELGAGTSEKTRLLLDAMSAAGSLNRVVVLDVDEPTLRTSAERLSREYPGAEVVAVVADLERHLGQLPSEGRRMIAFLGSSIGNFRPDERSALLRGLGAGMRAGDTFLLGTDLVKEPARLEAAYDDSRGVTARFSLNVLAVLNRELGADFDPEGFRHVAAWDPRNEWIDIRLRSLRAQRVRIETLDLEVRFDEDEELCTEISAKFRHERLVRELADAGLALAASWTDEDGDFAVALARAKAR